jgi:SAM-dependent methyltransferase
MQATFAVLPAGEYLNHAAQRMLGSHAPEVYLRGLRRQTAKIETLNARFPLEGKTVVEIGPGWNAIGIICLSLMGAGNIHTFDHQPHVRFDLVREMLSIVRDNEPRFRAAVTRLLGAKTLEEFFAMTSTHYSAPGDASRTGLADKSVDLVYSYGVLEHIPVEVLDAITQESARILKSDGIAFHRIGLHDHFQSIDPSLSSVNFLKYSNVIWRIIAQNRIHYHNRLRATHYVNMFERHGGKIVFREDELEPRDIEAAKTIKLAIYRDLPPEDLAISEMDVDVSFKN